MTNFLVSPLSPLCETQHPIAELVNDFLGSGDAWTIDSWFQHRTKARFQDEGIEEEGAFDLDQIQLGRRAKTDGGGRLLSLRANYFRGFRKQEAPVDLSGGLVVIDGRNSSGKTSLAEAIEWLLTGMLARRDFGDSKELADCIAHSLTPDGELTWVEAEFEYSDQIWRFRRELVEDYSSKSTSCCVSSLFLNDERVDESNFVLESAFAGVAPLLMQHTLQRFVFDRPAKRRDYFERLLNVDEITQLIQKAVVGDDGLARFPRESGKPLSAWTEELLTLSESAPEFLKDVVAGPRREVATELRTYLSRIASQLFHIAELTEIETAVSQIQNMQRLARQREFPLLEKLTPKRKLDPEALSRLKAEFLQAEIETLLQAQANLHTAKESEEDITEAQLAISKSLDALRQAGLIRDEELQQCPLCAFEDSKTLSKIRIDEALQWSLVRQSLAAANTAFESRTKDTGQAIQKLIAVRKGLIPCDIQKRDMEAAKNEYIRDAFEKMRIAYNEANEELLQFDQLSGELVEKLTAKELNYAYGDTLSEILKQLPKIESLAQKYEQAFTEFEDIVSQRASTDQEYVARQNWLTLVDRSSVLADDIIWDGALRVTQRELKSMRSSLIEFRQHFLESRRTDFSDGMTEIWSLLREDRYSGFSEIRIPKPSGKGFPVRIDVTASLDDNNEQREVDALKVMSESQVNAIGIAAFVTRSKLLGHRCVVMDDPVQSMDDEHFKSFAKDLLDHLCENGFQVIVLTHSDLFAREISHIHFDREEYMTLKIAHSRRNGIQITEGNRRVAERLKLAEHFGDEGDFDRAWYYVRLAIERFYTVAYLQHGPDSFNPHSWKNQSAEYMWDAGVTDVFHQLAPGHGERLKEIVDFTAAGSHDKEAQGLTVLTRAIGDIRPLLPKLRVGG